MIGRLPRRTLIPLLLILALAGALRLYDLPRTPPGLYPDEAMNGNNALEALRTGNFRVYYPENNGREGLMIVIQALSLALFGVREPWVLRVPSALIGVATVAGVFVLARELISPSVGCLAAFLLATSTWHIHFSRTGFRAILAPLLAVWTVSLLLIALRRVHAAARWGGVAAGAGVVCGLGFYSYIGYRIMPVLLLLVLFCYRRTTGVRRVAGVCVAATVVVALPIGVYFATHPEEFVGRTSEVSVFADERPLSAFADNAVRTVAMLFSQGDANWRHNHADRAQLFLPVAGAFTVGVGLLLTTLAQGGPARVPTVLLGWLLLAVLPVALSSEGIPHALRSILMLPPVMIIGALGVDRLWTLAAPRLRASVRVVVIVGCCAGLTYEAYDSYFRRYARRGEVQTAFTASYVEIGRAIERLPMDTRKIVVVDATGLGVRGVRMPAQTVMFMTDTFDPAMAARKHIVYVDPDDLDNIEPGVVFHLR